MIKSKISFQLSLSFAAALMIFALIIGMVFAALFRNHTISIHKEKMQEQAERIAETLSDYMTGSNGNGHQGGYGAYVKLFGEIAGSNIWIIDDELNLSTCEKGEGHGHGTGHNRDYYNYSDLLPNAEGLIQEVFEGKTIFSEDFSNILAELTLTVGVPIKQEQKIAGVVLLHSPVNGINKAVSNGFLMLANSMLLAIIISFVIALLFSHAFTKPLRKMKETAVRMTEGNYHVKSEIHQNNEIGELSDALDILAEKLEFASGESEKMEQMRRDFVANVSHELRTPITVIRGSIEALKENVIAEPDKIQNYYAQMLLEVKFLERLVGELLDLSRLQNTDFPIEKTEVYLNELLSDVVRSAGQIAEKKRVEIKLIKEEQNLSIYGDYGRLRQMLLIILDNAIKFSPEGEIVTVILKDKILKICDKGKGIEPKQIPYIFERFHKIPNEENKNGTGLGLAIAKQIAQRHEIELKVENNPKLGTVFFFKLS